MEGNSKEWERKSHVIECRKPFKVIPTIKKNMTSEGIPEINIMCVNNLC